MPEEKTVNINNTTETPQRNSVRSIGREEIFSTASKKIKLTTQNPLEDKTDEEQASSKNTQELFEILEFLDKVNSNAEKSDNASRHELKLPKGSVDANRIESASQQLHKSAQSQHSYEKKGRILHTEPESEQTKVMPKSKKSDKIVVNHGKESSVPFAQEFVSFSDEASESIAEPSIPVISFSVGKFSQVVRSQYDEHMKQLGLQKVKASEKKREKQLHHSEKHNTQKEKKEHSQLFKIPHKKSFSKASNDEPSLKENAKQIEILTNENTIKAEEIKKAELYKTSSGDFLRCVGLILITVAAVTVFALEYYKPGMFDYDSSPGCLVFCIINLVLALLGCIISKNSIVSGFKGIKESFGNNDTPLSFAAVAVLLQGIVSLFFVQNFDNSSIFLYSPVLLLGLTFNCLGKLFTNERIRNNYAFLKSPKKKYIVENYTDKYQKAQMLNGVAPEKSSIAYQTRFESFKNFFTLSYSQSGGFKLINRLSLPFAAVSLICTAMYAIKSKNVADAFTVFAIISCAGIPFSAFLSSSLFLRKISKASLKRGAMTSGFDSSLEYNMSGAVVTDMRSIYPKGALSLKAVRKFNKDNIDSTLIKAISVTKAVGSPLYEIFTDILSNPERLPEADSVLYEEGKGIVGWVNGERMLIGSAELLSSHGIDTPSLDYKNKFTDGGENSIVYIADAGELCAMLAVKYRAEQRVAKAMHALEDSGIAILIRSADQNVTAEKIAKDFGLYHRSIKILPTGLGNTCKELCSVAVNSCEPHLVTTGSFVSMAHGLSGCKRLASGMKILSVIQLISLILCMCIAVLLVLYSGLSKLNPISLIFYCIFWAVASIAVQALIRH